MKEIITTIIIGLFTATALVIMADRGTNRPATPGRATAMVWYSDIEYVSHSAHMPKKRR